MKYKDVGCLGNTIITSTGLYFDYANPQPEQIIIKDIAKGLSNTCRFAGQSDFYSVAEHCILAREEAVKREPENIKLHLAILLHDASEAYTGDIPKPLKNMLPDFEKVERKIEKAIELKFGLEINKKLVKEIDLCMLKAEKAVLFPNDKEIWTGFENIKVIKPDFKFWFPWKVKLVFLKKFYNDALRLNI